MFKIISAKSVESAKKNNICEISEICEKKNNICGICEICEKNKICEKK